MTLSSAMDQVDTVVVGGGPAGLAAALYLARYHLSVTLYDDGTSRARYIPTTHNQAGFPEGISGKELLRRMRVQAERFGAEIRRNRVLGLQKQDDGYVVRSAAGELRARTVLLATGVFNRRPDMPEEDHDEAVRRGLLRYCPVCDGYEVTDKPVGIIGRGSKGFSEAVFLRSFSRHITLISPQAEHGLSEEERQRLQMIGVGIVAGPVTSIGLTRDAISVGTAAGVHAFASVYPALGSEVRSTLAAEIGAKVTEEGCMVVDRHQRSNIPALYGAGDVIVGLDQISTALGQAAIAATAIRNDLCSAKLLIR
jgi:thioredoxin reductase (NADPH)